MSKSTPRVWAALILASLILFGTTFVIGASASGLDIAENCTRAAQVFDYEYLAMHQEEAQRIFPMYSPCNASFDLVPAWVNPGLLIFALLALAFLAAFVVSLAKLTRTSNGRSHDD